MQIDHNDPIATRCPRGSATRRPGRWQLLAAVAAVMGAALLGGGRPAIAAEAIAWGTAVPWLGFDDALARATAEGKAIGVVVYADWCPKCRALAPAFVEGPVLAASNKILWVLQNSDERPEWLEQRFGQYGNYVPRIFFLKPDGTVDPEITSGHPRFPYFYLAGKPEALVASIDRAAAAGAPPAAKVAVAEAPAAVPVAPAPLAAAPAPAPTPGGWTDDLPLFGVLAAALAAAFWAVRTGKDDA